MSDEDPTIDWPGRRSADPPQPPNTGDVEPTAQIPRTPRSPGGGTPPTPPPPWSGPPAAGPPPASAWNTPGSYPQAPIPPPPGGGAPPWQAGAPPGSYPPPPAEQPGSRPRRGRRWWVLGGAAVLAAGIVATTVVIVTGRDDTTPAAAPGEPSPSSAAPAPSTSMPAPTSPAAPPVPNIEPAALPGLLLSAEEISQRMGRPGMEAGQLILRTSPDSTIDPANCDGVWGVGDTSTYDGSFYTGIAGRNVNEKPKAYHAAVQAVVAFPDAAAAKAFYDKQVANWDACKYRKFVASYSDGATDEGTIGVPTNTDGTMNLLLTITDIPTAPTMACERAMSVRANVIVDVRACSPDIGNAGLTIARDIAAKVTGTQ